MKRNLTLLITALFLTGCAKSEGKQAQVINAKIEIENYGSVEVELYPDIAPLTVENFVKLAKDGFYNGTTFHRIIDGFMIQGGANPSRKAEAISGEFASNGFENNLKHTEGVLSMARANDPDSATSQFFIMVGDAPWLNGEYAAFGKVTSGLEIVKQIAKDARPIDDNGTIPQSEQPVITSITILD